MPDINQESKRGRACATIREYNAGTGCTGRLISEESRTVGLTLDNGCYEYGGASGSEYCDDEGYHWLPFEKSTECKGTWDKPRYIPQVHYPLGCNSGYIDWTVECTKGPCA